MTDAIIRNFVAEQRELLELELQAESDQDSSTTTTKATAKNKKGRNDDQQQEERSSHILGNLEASDVSVGLYGRTVVQLTLWKESTSATALSSSSDEATTSATTAKPSSSFLLPAHRFTVGDEVEIRTKKSTKSSGHPGGVISAVTDTFVSVALFSNNNNKNNNNSKNSGQQTSSSKKNGKGSGSNNNNGDDDDDDDDSNAIGPPPLSLVPKSSIEVNKKMIHALQDLERDGVNHPIAGSIIQCMFQKVDQPRPPKNNATVDGNEQPSSSASWFQPFNTNLDASQQEAIQFALQDDRKIALIHGPPGTGKTTTIAELIYQAVHVKKMKVLCTAPSNVAVDNILERIVAMKQQQQQFSSKAKKKQQQGNNSSNSNNQKFAPIRAVRLGHPARIKSSIVSYSLEALVQSADGTEIVADVRQELQSFLRIISNPKSRAADKRIAYREMKSLRKEIRTREEKVVQELLSSAQVVLATTVGAANRILNKILESNNNSGKEQDGFDLVVIDEAAQALEASCWIPILRGKKVVLAGDHCQLPPTIKSNHPRVQKGLSRTMFERLMELYGDNNKDGGTPQISRMLKVQYRMHEKIADWASQAMYHGELQTHESVKNRKLLDLDAVAKVVSEAAASQTAGNKGSSAVVNAVDEFAETTILLVDTAGCAMYETVNAAGSRFNEGEANVVSQHVRKLLEMGLQQKQLAIITPYNGQVELLRSMLLPDFPQLEIRSVDGFQGGERDAVILSLVRSSQRGGENGIGFLKDDRRHNVAVTRAKRHLAIVCDSETVSSSKFVQNLITWAGEHGEERSAIEYLSSSSSSDQLYNQDIQTAEAELLKMVEATFSDDPQSSKTNKQVDEKKKNEERRKALMDKISAFAEKGSCGDELVLASELTSYDRRLVHEFAEQVGLGHRSEGVDGVDRRLILTIAKGKAAEEVAKAAKIEKAEEVEIDEQPPAKAVPSFAVLADAESDSDDTTEDQQAETEAETQAEEAVTPPPTNSLLGQLAAERAQRQKQNQAVAAAAAKQADSGEGKSKKKKSKAKACKLGGKKIADATKEESCDDLDDMAFLDKQIEKSQNAHGRKVVGTGKTYRTIVNGILNERPKPPEPERNTRAGAALQSKLKEAQNARTKKVKKKK